MNDNELKKNVSILIDKYFTSPTNNIVKDSNSITIRHALEGRTGEYFKKSFLNNILIEKGFLHKKINDLEYCFNISSKDIQILSRSKDILEKLNQKTNYSFTDYIKYLKYRNVDYYKYTFKYWIKIKFEKDYSENIVYQVLAKETNTNLYELKKSIEILNSDYFPEMKPYLYDELLKIFNITTDESITNKNI